MFTFVDLFSGIGGFHKACHMKGGKCLLACEIDEGARKIYQMNYGIIPHDDIRTLQPLKNIDLVCAGFPCQSHSTLGKRRGKNDERGKLFDVLKDFIDASKPKSFLLENVTGILSSNRGHMFKHIIQSLEAIGYKVSWCVLDSKNFGLPQHRERVYIVGHKEIEFKFDRLLSTIRNKKIKDIMDKKPNFDDLHCDIFEEAEIFDPPIRTGVGFVLRAKMSNFTNRKLFSSSGIIGTIPTASPPPIYDERYHRPRHLSKNELKRCQGFPVSFKFPGDFSRSQVVHYVGNAVSVNVISSIVQSMISQKLLK